MAHDAWHFGGRDFLLLPSDFITSLFVFHREMRSEGTSGASGILPLFDKHLHAHSWSALGEFLLFHIIPLMSHGYTLDQHAARKI